MSTPIQPFVIQTTQTVASFNVSCRSLNLFTDAVFTVDSFDSNNNLISRQIVTITNEQYLEWNNNDSFIIDLMATLLGYTLVTPVVSATNNTVPSIDPISTVNGP